MEKIAERNWTLRELLGLLVFIPLLLGGFLIRVSFLIDRYDQLSVRSHSALIRSVFPWRFGRLASLLPVLCVLLASAAQSSPMWTGLIIMVVTLLLLEVYAVALHRESYIAAFEPWFLPEDSRPLGGHPARHADRRLQQLIRVHSEFLVGLVAASVLAGSSISFSTVIVVLFVIKYIPSGWLDYEAYAHWDMHTNVLRMTGANQWIEKSWRFFYEIFLGTAIGSLPWMYSTEHLRLHHPHNGGPHDVHSPLPYRRTSPIGFLFFFWRCLFVAGTQLPILARPHLRRHERARIILSTAIYWSVLITSLVYFPALGLWLILALIYRSANTAVSQYVWHGMYSGDGDSSPLHTTVMWVPPHQPMLVDGDIIETYPGEWRNEDGPPSVPGREWAFFDNYHLLHHLHPRAHFTKYPELLVNDAERIERSAAAVISLSGYGSFFSDIMGLRLDKVGRAFVGRVLSAQNVAQLLEPFPTVKSVSVSVSDSHSASALEPLAGYLLGAGWISQLERSSTLVSLGVSS